MSGLAAADMIQSTEEHLTLEVRPASVMMGLNTGMNAAEGMQLSRRKLISYTAWRGANKYIFYESDLDTAVQTGNVKFLNLFFDYVHLDEQVKTRMVSNAFTNLFDRKFNKINKYHNPMVKRLLELGADVNGGPSVFPLSVAIEAGSYPLVELLCQHGADLNKRNRTYGMFRQPPLSIAAACGYYDIIEVMLKFGANVHYKIQDYSPIDWALARGHTDCANLLLKHGATFDLKSAFQIVIDHQNMAYINFLLVHCRQETQQYISEHQQDLLLSAVRLRNIEFFSHIFDVVFDITGEYPCWEKLLVESGDGEIASFLIQKGADVNKLVETCGRYTPVYWVLSEEFIYKPLETCDSSYTPLYWVLSREVMCDTSKVQLIKVLLENGASPNICGDTSPLMLVALKNNSTDLLQLLLDYGADINWRDNKGDSAFSYSVYQGCDSNAEFLIRCAKDKHFINSQNNEGLTVLMQAARYSNVAVVKGVINHNPDMNMTDNNGNTALLHAINRASCSYDSGTADIVTTLINAGCDVNLQNDDGLSPLMLATSRYRKEFVQILLYAGADINAVSKTDETKTALSYFQLMICNNKDITAWLAVFLAQGACLSYLQPKMFHRILLCDDSDTICKLITNGTGPVAIRSDKYLNFFSPADPTFDISPLFTALISGNASLARHLVDIMWLTKSDLTSLTHNKPVRSYLEKKNHTQCLNLLGEMSSQPVSLFRLAFVEVSSAVGTTPGRENRVNKLPLPQRLKDKLLFKSVVDSITPIMDMVITPIRDMISVSFFDPSPKLNINARDFCKCCRVWKNLKLNGRLRTSNFCFTCAGHSCSECFLGYSFTQSRIL